MAFAFKPPMPRYATCQRTLIILGFFLQVGGALDMADPAARSGSPGPVAKPDPVAKLDQKAVHDEYVNGNFEIVVEKITAFQKENPRHSRDDSIFIARHLAVVHAADPKSVEAGKYWMDRLILLSPAADLSGMYVSEEIDRLFARVKQEARVGSGDGKRRKWLWLAAGGTVLAVAATAWMLHDGGSDDSRTVEVDL